jgi:aryl-alcohol dehydrogenase-like predicted oxidoreductase
MRYVTQTGTSKQISKVGLGTWQFGSRDWGYGDEYEKRTGELVARARALGITLFDTAEIYGRGRSEELLGDALGEARSTEFVATKLLPLLPIPSVARDHARRSAARLGVSRLDLYQVHFPNPLVGDSVIMAGLRSLQDDGLVDLVGVSNYSAARWRSAETALGRPVFSNQVRYNLAQTKPEAEVIPHASTHGRLVIAYSPLAQGLFSGKYTAANPPTGSARSRNPLFLPENLERLAPLLDTVKQVADAHDVTPSQIALAYVLHQPSVVAIPGASSVAQVEANAQAADIELTDDEYAALATAAGRFTPLSTVRTIPKLLRPRSKTTA